MRWAPCLATPILSAFPLCSRNKRRHTYKQSEEEEEEGCPCLALYLSLDPPFLVRTRGDTLKKEGGEEARVGTLGPCPLLQQT